jgi:hypothetical protein
VKSWVTKLEMKPKVVDEAGNYHLNTAEGQGLLILRCGASAGTDPS